MVAFLLFCECVFYNFRISSSERPDLRTMISIETPSSRSPFAISRAFFSSPSARPTSWPSFLPSTNPISCSAIKSVTFLTSLLNSSWNNIPQSKWWCKGASVWPNYTEIPDSDEPGIVFSFLCYTLILSEPASMPRFPCLSRGRCTGLWRGSGG